MRQYIVTVLYRDELFDQDHSAEFRILAKDRHQALSLARIEWLELYDMELGRNDGVGLWRYCGATAAPATLQEA